MEAKRQDIGMDIDENKKDTQNKTNTQDKTDTSNKKDKKAVAKTSSACIVPQCVKKVALSFSTSSIFLKFII